MSPSTDAEADYNLLRYHIRDVLDHGSNVRKAMFEALIAEIQVNSDEALTPIFRLPMIRENEDPAESESKTASPAGGSRTYIYGGRYWD